MKTNHLAILRGIQHACDHEEKSLLDEGVIDALQQLDMAALVAALESLQGCARWMLANHKSHTNEFAAACKALADVGLDIRPEEARQLRSRREVPIGERSSCALCGQDIEYSGNGEWRDRGGNRSCVPYKKADGEIITPPDGSKHRP
jgi:hypothetical protein